MPIPSGVTTRLVRGTYVNGDGTVQQGTVTFRVDQPLLATVTSWGVIPSPTVVTLDSAGGFSVTLMASNDEGLFPSGFMWIVQERFQGGYLRTYRIELEPDSDPLDLPAATQYDPGDAGLGVVHSVNGLTGNVLLSADTFGGLLLTGGTLTGPLILNSDPVVPDEATTMRYTDTKLAKTANLGDLPNLNQAQFNLGISDVDNTSDLGKPVSTATQTALNTKLTKTSNLADLTDTNAARANLDLSNVDDTSDADKPISTATQTALDTKLVKAANLADLTSTTTARASLGLGTSATKNVGTIANTVAAGDDARFTDQRVPTDGSVTSVKIADGTIVNADISPSAAITLSRLAVDPLARANHTGTQTASTISDLSASVATTAALKANNLSDLASASGARTNLGLGNAALLNVGTTAGTVAAGDDLRLTDQRVPTDGSVVTTKIVDGAVTSLKIADGTIVNADINAAAAIALSKLATDPLARANHTGTQLASTISDLGTAVASTALLKASNLSDLASAPTARTSLGLGNVDNTTDLNKPISTATQTGLDGKLAKASNLADLTSASTARTSLGLGTSAVLNVGVIAGTVAAGDDARLTDQRTPLDNSVTAAKIATDAVITVKIQDLAVSTAKVADAAVTTIKIADGNVTSAKIADGTIVNADLNAAAAIDLSKLAVNPLARANHTGTQLSSTVSDLAATVQAYRLDQFAAPNVALSAGSQRITNLATPTATTDATTKAYVDTSDAGMYTATRQRPRLRPGTIVTQMQTGHGWTIAGSGATGNVNDTTAGNFIIGSQAATITSGGTGANSSLRKFASTVPDLTNSYIRLRLRVSDITRLGELKFHVGTASNANGYGWSFFVNGGDNYLINNEWSIVTLSFADAVVQGTPAALNAQTDAELRVYDTNAGLPVTVQLQSVEVVANETLYPNGVCAIGFDDDFAGQKTNGGWAAMDALGYPATLYSINDYLGTGGRLTLADLKIRQDEFGWEIATHALTGTNHGLSQTGMTAAQVDADLSTQRGIQRLAGIFGSGGYAYPKGQFGATTDAVSTLDLVRKTCDYARTTHFRTMETLPPAEIHKIRGRSSIGGLGGYAVSNLTTATTGAIDRAVANKSLLVLVMHDITTGASTSTTECSIADFQAVLNKLNSAGMPVRTLGSIIRSLT